MSGVSRLNVNNSISLNNTNVSLDGTSQINARANLYLYGGINSNSTTASFNLPLASTPTNGMISFGNNLGIATNGVGNAAVSETISGQRQFHELHGLAPDGRLVRRQPEWLGERGHALGFRQPHGDFAGEANLATNQGWGTNEFTGSPIASTATLNVTGGAKLNIGGNMNIGDNNSNGEPRQQYSITTLNVDGSSQLNITGSLYLRGNGGMVDPTHQNNNYATLHATYSIPLAATPTNGKVSIRGGITVADTSYNNVAVTFNGTPGSTIYSNQSINVATSSTEAEVTFNGVGFNTTGNGNFATSGPSNWNGNYLNTATVAAERGLPGLL